MRPNIDIETLDTLVTREFNILVMGHILSGKTSFSNALNYYLGYEQIRSRAKTSGISKSKFKSARVTEDTEKLEELSSLNSKLQQERENLGFEGRVRGSHKTEVFSFYLSPNNSNGLFKINLLTQGGHTKTKKLSREKTSNDFLDGLLYLVNEPVLVLVDQALQNRKEAEIYAKQFQYDDQEESYTDECVNYDLQYDLTNHKKISRKTDVRENLDNFSLEYIDPLLEEYHENSLEVKKSLFDDRMNAIRISRNIPSMQIVVPSEKNLNIVQSIYLNESISTYLQNFGFYKRFSQPIERESRREYGEQVFFIFDSFLKTQLNLDGTLVSITKNKPGTINYKKL